MVFLASGCRAVCKCSGGDVVSDLLAAERSPHKVHYKENSFPSVELHLHNSSAHQRGSGLGRTLETHWALMGFMGLLAKLVLVIADASEPAAWKNN